MANAPLSGRDGETSRSDLGQSKTELFLKVRLDRANHFESLQQIVAFKQRPALECSGIALAATPKTAL
jgi:hypothetical protein